MAKTDPVMPSASGAASRGKFVWYELATSDPAGAIAFYTKVIGWGSQPWDTPPGAPSYTMWTVGATPIGGVMQLPDDAVTMGAKPNWLAYISTPDVDATVAQAKTLRSAVLVPPTDIPTVGRFAVVRDPDGAIFAPFTPSGAGMGGGAGEPRVGEFCWSELATRDNQEALKYYATLFGWQETGAHDMGPMGTYRLFGLGGTAFGGVSSVTASAAPGVRPHWLHYIEVASVDAAAAQVTKLEGRVINGPMEVPGGARIAQCIDPQGALFAVHTRKKG
jgi:hypothetical protein